MSRELGSEWGLRVCKCRKLGADALWRVFTEIGALAPLAARCCLAVSGLQAAYACSTIVKLLLIHYYHVPAGGTKVYEERRKNSMDILKECKDKREQIEGLVGGLLARLLPIPILLGCAQQCHALPLLFVWKNGSMQIEGLVGVLSCAAPPHPCPSYQLHARPKELSLLARPFPTPIASHSAQKPHAVPVALLLKISQLHAGPKELNF